MGDLICVNDWGPFGRKLATNPALQKATKEVFTNDLPDFIRIGRITG